jgi:ABC-type Mn2+/Zn2+ transport system permease subunit
MSLAVLGLLGLEPVVRNALVVAVAMAIACGVLSVFVVTRHWAFVGEGISHSGFGGAGTAWLLAVLVPSLDQPWVPYLAVVLFCVLTALGIGLVTARERVATDTAVGIFLVATLAWGFVGQQIYFVRTSRMPVGFENILFGRQLIVPDTYALVAVLLSAAVVLVVAALGKEIVAYSFDPLLARTSGVRTGLIHYLLISMIAVTVALSIPMVGSVLVTALLVLPGAAALLLSARLPTVMVASLAVALLGAVGGIAVHQVWRFLPTGPAIVLVLVGQLLLALLVRQSRRAWRGRAEAVSNNLSPAAL